MKNRKLRRLASIAVLSFVFIITLTILAIVYDYSKSIARDNYTITRDWIGRFEPAAADKTLKDKKIVFRIDDVQIGYLDDVSMDMVKDAEKRGIKLVLGIIPSNFSEDKLMTGFIREHKNSVEIAVHGWEHSVNGNYDTPEFGEIGYADAVEKLKMARQELSGLSDMPIITFIPPQNKISNDGKRALIDMGFTVLSSDSNGHFDTTVSTYNWSEKKLTDPQDVVFECAMAVYKEKLCVVMAHPQDYTTGHQPDKDKYAKYLEVLEGLKRIDASITNFSEINRQ